MFRLIKWAFFLILIMAGYWAYNFWQELGPGERLDLRHKAVRAIEGGDVDPLLEIGNRLKESIIEQSGELSKAAGQVGQHLKDSGRDTAKDFSGRAKEELAKELGEVPELPERISVPASGQN